jgi:hypothetical protein
MAYNDHGLPPAVEFKDFSADCVPRSFSGAGAALQIHFYLSARPAVAGWQQTDVGCRIS